MTKTFTDDRELLEAAARAQGRRVVAWMCDGNGVEVARLDDGSRWQPMHANQLTDCDGDALRLAVRMGIRIEPSARGCSVMWPVGKGLRVDTVLCSAIGCTAEAATRRAIVRAAAAAGGEHG